MAGPIAHTMCQDKGGTGGVNRPGRHADSNRGCILRSHHMMEPLGNRGSPAQRRSCGFQQPADMKLIRFHLIRYRDRIFIAKDHQKTETTAR